MLGLSYLVTIKVDDIQLKILSLREEK